MGKKVREYKSGDFIFAKVKGYPAWPARVQRQNGKKYFVYFYGTGETANLPPNMIFDYSENKDKFLNKSVKRKDFNDGVKQIEHDFANNVPLEQVVGTLAEGDPAPANDSLNDTANETADDSAIADTTADETMDETANDGPVEDSDDAGALVIDEGKKARKSSVKPAATPKAKEPKTPRGRPRKEEPKEAKEAKEADEEEKKDEEIVSRSGRKIRPKRYMDEQTEENSTLPSPATKKRRGASPSAEKEKAEPKEKPQDKNIRAYNTVQQSELRELKEPFKSVDADKENILMTYLPSGTYCGVKLFQSRPASFKSEASRLQWDKQAASNAITLKRQLEKGQITPQSISAQLVMDLNLTDEEKEKLDKDRDLEIKKARLHFLKTEMKLIELDAKIKTCLSLEKADTELCLKLIDEILELDLAALMLLKHPTCMETVKRMRVYVGNTPSWAMTESEALTFSKQAHRIRNKADALFITMRDLFEVPEGLSFWEFFNERVAQFKAVTENLHADKLLEMVHEPIEMSQPTSHTMKAAIDAANEEDAAEAEDTDKKKKATPAKAKKANSTPLKQPLKRQPRKQQQEEKEKEKEAEKPAEDKPEEPDTNKPTENDKTDSTEAPKENNDDKSNADKANENETDEADKEVEKVNENSEKTDPKEAVSEEKADKPKEDKEKESNSKEDIENKTNETDKSEDKDSEASAKESKKSKDDKSSDKNSKDSGKSKDKNDKGKDDKKDDAKNGKDKARAGDKRKEKGKDEKEKSEEKEKVDVDEPRAKRSRESKKTEPPPRSPAKRKSKS